MSIKKNDDDKIANSSTEIKTSNKIKVYKDPLFNIGDIVKHRIYPFRGVIVDVDPEFSNTEEWYQSIPAEIIEALDGPITLTSCVNKSESFCETSDICFLGGKWNKINEVIRKSLNDISLEDFLNYENPFLIENNKDTLIDRIN